MSIFNSLGSNYSFQFACQSLFSLSGATARKELLARLTQTYKGETVLVYKARQAIRLALSAIQAPPGSRVALNGFTCLAVYQAVVDAGYTPHYLDIDPKSLNFSADSLKEAIERYPDIKAVIVQNTLGFECEIGKVASLCRSSRLALIEDLAHSIGGQYSDGREMGTVGDFTVLSFSQDKVVDGVSGGALIVRNSNYLSHLLESSERKITFAQMTKDRFYPFLTWLIRSTYDSGFGRAVHRLAKNFNWLPRPVESESGSERCVLSDWHCRAIESQYKNLPTTSHHRKMIAQTYLDSLPAKILTRSSLSEQINSVNLRFSIFVADREGLIQHLKNNHVHVSDIWYDAPIAPAKYINRTKYTFGTCPQAEKIAGTILNLPTHINVSAAEAKRIAELVSSWTTK